MDTFKANQKYISAIQAETPKDATDVLWKIHEEEIGPDRFCLEPHVRGCCGTVFRLVPEEGTYSYLRIEVCEGVADGTRLRLGRHLVKEYKRAQQPDPRARFNGALVLNQLCKSTDEGFIEPYRASR